MTTKCILAAVVCLSLALAVVSCAESVVTYEKALEISATKGNSLQSYDIKGAINLENTVGGNSMGAMELSVRSAAVWPNRLLNTIKGDMTNVNFGTGSESSWFWLDQLGACYVGQPRDLTRNMDGKRELSLDESEIYDFYTGLGQFMLPQDLAVSGDVTTEVLSIGGQDVTCTVFQVAAAHIDSAAIAMGEPHEGAKTYWFDSSSGLVVKSIESFSGMNRGSTVEQIKTQTLQSFTLNQDVADAEFVFTPAEGVKVVDSFDRLTNPDSMVGVTAPEVIFTDMDGGSVALSEFQGKVVFLDLWATWCPPCRQEMPHIEKLFQEYAGRDDVIFLAASSEDKQTISNFIAKEDYNFKILMVKAEDAQGKFKASSIPAGFVIDKDGVIRAHMIGAQNEAQLRAALAKGGFSG